MHINISDIPIKYPTAEGCSKQ